MQFAFVGMKYDRMFCLFLNDSNNNENVRSIVYEIAMILVELSEVTLIRICVCINIDI